MKTVEVEWGRETLSIEVGRMAKQANGAVVVGYGDTLVLVTAVVSAEPRKGATFFPLMVDYQEMTYAAGKIPGGFFKREGRPTEKEILTSRFIDRPLRPLFPDNFFHDVQVIATVLSADNENDPNILAIIGASAALEISDIPFQGPVAGVRVGRIDGKLVFNPSIAQMEGSELDLIVAGSESAVVMVEGGIKNLPEELVLEAILFGHESLKEILLAQKALRESLGKPKIIVPERIADGQLGQQVRQLATEQIRQAIRVAGKKERSRRLSEIAASTLEQLPDEYAENQEDTRAALEDIEKEAIRDLIVKERVRIDGRAFDEIRPISCEVAMLPCAHGSALFTRGETQVMVATTLGTSSDEQKIDSLVGETYKTFMLHYNFPPFSVGEVKFLRGPSRREVGHGALAERAIAGVLPSGDDFPYTIRVVSDVLESNGSSSMATVCGGVLSLMDAGVPIRQPVAGVALGLIKEGDETIVLSDILGDEDHVGDMDFKVAGTQDGITALQMDIKIKGLTGDILLKALAQAREGRLFILDKMSSTLSEPRATISERAPRISIIQVKSDKIRDIIGPGGKTIRQIIDQTGCKIEVEDSGKVTVAGNDLQCLDKAVKMIQELVQEAEVNQVYLGKVKRVVDFGAFVEIFPGTEGLVHISQLAPGRVGSVRDVVKEGDEVLVKVLDIDRQGKIRLSRKEALDHNQPS